MGDMQYAGSLTTTPCSEEAFVRAWLQQAVNNGDSVALWRLPNSHTRNLLTTSAATRITSQDAVEDFKPGFIFASFSGTNERYYLPADSYFTFEEGELRDSTVDPEVIAAVTPSSNTNTPVKFYRNNMPITNTVPHTYQELVQLGIQRIEEGYLEKIVPSRRKQVALPEDFDALQAFNKLCLTYPHAMITLVSIPNVGTWLGATPELLVEVTDQHIFRTVALAGTKSFAPGTDLKHVAWTQKEIEEQALVCRYIINCFKKIRLREYDEQGPRTVVAGNLMHLKTTYTVDMKATGFPSLGSTMLGLLHPTSAVCGMPLEPARQFLQAHEGYDREFYAGYLGPVNIGNTISLFVNLRCMQLMAQDALVYAGAGVTADSDAQKEWEETETKMNTLLNVIR